MIKGIKKMDHLGITVPNIDEALSFFKTHFKAKTIGKAFGFQSEDDWMQTHLNVHPRSVIENIEMIELFDGTVLELFQYKSLEQNSNYPRNNEAGGHHLAFEVEDIEEAMIYLEENNIEVLGSYTFNESSWPNINGSFESIKWIYFQTPWGMSMEFIEKVK